MCATSTEGAQWCNSLGALHWLTITSQHANIPQDMDFIGIPSCSEHALLMLTQANTCAQPSQWALPAARHLRNAQEEIQLGVFQTDTILTICLRQCPRLVHLELLTNFEINCQWSIAKRNKNNAKQKHKCHFYILLPSLLERKGSFGHAWNNIRLHENNMKWHETTRNNLPSTWTRLHLHPCFRCNTWVPPALFQAFSGLGAPAQCKWGKPNVVGFLPRPLGF